MSKKILHTSPLRRCLRSKISEEDPDDALYDERLPFRYLIGKSVDKYIDNPRHPFEDPDDEDAARIATRALVYEYVSEARGQIYSAMRVCESPIERTMLAALTVIAARRGTPIEMKLPEDPLIAKVIKEDNYPGDQRRVVIYVKPQAQLGDYRVDFLLEYKAMVMANPPETEQEATQRMARQVEEIMTQGYATPDWVFKYVEVDLIIECDGHDFHEKTKHQAARDKQRDRLLQSIGYKVFRYTGSEIHRDAISCAEEVIDTLHSTARAIAVQKYKDSH